MVEALSVEKCFVSGVNEKMMRTGRAKTERERERHRERDRERMTERERDRERNTPPPNPQTLDVKRSNPNRCQANMAHVRQSRSESSPGNSKTVKSNIRQSSQSQNLALAWVTFR